MFDSYILRESKNVEKYKNLCIYIMIIPKLRIFHRPAIPTPRPSYHAKHNCPLYSKTVLILLISLYNPIIIFFQSQQIAERVYKGISNTV